MHIEPINVDRTWIGARPGSLTNPTLWLFAFTALLFAVGSAGYLRGILPAIVTVPINTVAIYMNFTVLHEAMHGVAHRNRLFNATLGRIAAIFLIVSYPLFRGVHYEHHSHTNDPDRDPDFSIAREPRLAFPLFCLGLLMEYRVKFFGHRLWRDRKELFEAIGIDMALVGLLVVSIANGFFAVLFVIWILPAVISVLVLAFAFDFLPHYPYDTKARYFDTRIYPSKILNALLLGQNYHLIHHLWTTIPWYRYQKVFDQIGNDLDDRGCRIGWRVRPLPPGIPMLEIAAKADPRSLRK
jgi:beta-carotene hydroxylase